MRNIRLSRRFSNPAEMPGSAQRNANLISRYISRHGRSYYEHISEINDLLDRAAAHAGLRMIDYVTTAVPYERSVSLLLATSDPEVFVHVSIYRTSTGRYELVSYPTRASQKKKGFQRKVNPEAGDLASILAPVIARMLTETASRDGESEFRFGSLTLKVVRVSGSGLEYWIEHGGSQMGPEKPVSSDFTATVRQFLSRRDNPAGDFEDKVARGLADLMLQSVKPYENVRLPLRRKSIVLSEEDYGGYTEKYFWVETMGKRTSERHKVESTMDFSDAIHKFLHSGDIRGYRKTAGAWRKENPEDDLNDREFSSSEDEPVQGSDDAPVQEETVYEPGMEIEDLPEQYEDAQEVYETFHGAESQEEVNVEEAHLFRENLASLGILQEISLITQEKSRYTVSFENDPPLLCCSADSSQLYIIGGDQTIDDESLLEILSGDEDAVSKDLVWLGVVDKVVYRTQKDFDEFETIDYVHELGEDGGLATALIYDRLNSVLMLSGGSYKIKREGIVN